MGQEILLFTDISIFGGSDSDAILRIESSAGTDTVAEAVARSGATSVVGGGDSLAAVNRLGLGSEIGHLSTGGGASLEYIQGRTLPGVAALER